MGEVFVVDSQTTLDLVPHKQRIKGIYVLYTLLGLALFGVLVEGVLIYKLYQRISAQVPPESIQSFKQIGENKTQDDFNSEKTLPIPKPDKPAAFMQYGVATVQTQKSDLDVMQWNHQGFPAFMHSFNYSNGYMIIPKDGLYYLFSKVSFRNNCSMLKHVVELSSPRYSNEPIPLMSDRLSGGNQKHHENLCSSHLGGVFKLYKTDKVFVSVSNLNCVRGERTENFFGGFMI